MLVGYLSYFFDVENFAPRIKVVLTTMLVIATITTSIKAVSYEYTVPAQLTDVVSDQKLYFGGSD